MDTKSTNSKAYIFTKVIAVLLVVLTLGFSAVQVAKAYVKFEKQSSSYFRLSDTISIKNDENFIYSTYAFETKMENYLYSLAKLTHYYGDGSKEAYNAIAQENDYEALKKRFIYNLFYRVCNVGSEYVVRDNLVRDWHLYVSVLEKLIEWTVNGKLVAVPGYDIKKLFDAFRLLSLVLVAEYCKFHNGLMFVQPGM